MAGRTLPGHHSCLDPHHCPPLCPTLPIKGSQLIPGTYAARVHVIHHHHIETPQTLPHFSNTALNLPKYPGLSDSIAIGHLYPPGTAKQGQLSLHVDLCKHRCWTAGDTDARSNDSVIMGA